MNRAGGIELLRLVATRLGSQLDRVAFVGGQVVPLLITDPASESVRPTFDVDVVIPVVTRAEHAEFEAALRGLGFRNDTREGAPICRWLTPEKVIVDFMPAHDAVLGFSNRWYDDVLRYAVGYELEPALEIMVPPAPLFLATKWDAYRNRGNADPLASSDLEDIIAVVAGRASIVAEVESAEPELRAWLSDATAEFLADPMGDYAIAGALSDARLVPGVETVVRDRLRQIVLVGSA